MEYDKFDKIVLEHRNSLVIIGMLILVMCIIGILVIEFYVRGKLGCRYFKIGRWKFSPTYIMLIPVLIAVLYFSIQIHQCNLDVNNHLYDTYVGEVEYSSSSVKIKDKFSVFMGKGFELIPQGKHYGRCIYSHNAKVIVSWEDLSE